MEKIQLRTENQKMILNTKNTKAMVFNFTDNYQFRTRVTLKDQNIEIVDKAKLLGVIIINDLKGEENTANSRMELLRKVASFGT